MKMNFFVVAKLLSSTTALLFSGYLAFALSIIAILLKGWQSIEFWIFIVITLLLSFTHHYISFRVKFDAQLLEMMAQESKIESIENLTQQFDQSLVSMKLMPESKAGRDWSVRFAGCFKLFKIQIALLLLQYFVLIILIYRLLAQ
ncbi:hypothetical protein BEN71_10480 [Acinetobacter wuhouensis]|uniref:hypothetical protein n=1 Tax=Acinetobacter wuhouensis TaxID=1879050 RepID=UPI00083A05B5|nr:hypothetical protein [Acinetobacter wuhouensis]AXQ22472.1 hypothetical protein BEN71_10480 [Acinetobacter wuhouensis]